MNYGLWAIGAVAYLGVGAFIAGWTDSYNSKKLPDAPSAFTLKTFLFWPLILLSFPVVFSLALIYATVRLWRDEKGGKK